MEAPLLRLEFRFRPRRHLRGPTERAEPEGLLLHVREVGVNDIVVLLAGFSALLRLLLALRGCLSGLIHLFADLLRGSHQTFNSLINGSLVFALDLLFNVLDGALAGSAVSAFNLVAEILQGLLNLGDGGISLIAMFALESPTWAHIFAARSSILYSGVMSCGVAYTLQILGQKRTDPTSATLLMSLESVFAALSGWLILHQSFSLREFLGCVLVFAAVLLSQIPLPQKNIRTQKTSME